MAFANLGKNGVPLGDTPATSDSGSAHGQGQGGLFDDLPPADPQTNQAEGTPMPEILRRDVRPLDIPIPLISGAQATLRIPIPLSEADYELLTTLIDVNLKGMKQAIVTPAQTETTQPETPE